MVDAGFCLIAGALHCDVALLLCLELFFEILEIQLMERPVGADDRTQRRRCLVGDSRVIVGVRDVYFRQNLDACEAAFAAEHLAGLHEIVGHDRLQRQAAGSHGRHQRVVVRNGLANVGLEVHRHVVGPLRVGGAQIGGALGQRKHLFDEFARRAVARAVVRFVQHQHHVAGGSNRQQRAALLVADVDLRIRQERCVAPFWKPSRLRDLLQHRKLPALVLEQPLVADARHPFPGVEDQWRNVIAADVLQVAVHVGKQRRLDGHEHRRVARSRRPADHARSLPTFADAGLVGNDDAFALLNLVDGGRDGVDLQPHERPMQVRARGVAELRLHKIVDVADAVLERIERGLRWTRHVDGNQRAVALARAALDVRRLILALGRG